MTQETSVNTVAPLANVTICMAALQRAIDRPAHLPGIITFFGYSGYGKSTAAAYTANKHNAYYVQCMSTWPKKAFLSAVLHEMDIEPVGSISDLTLLVAEQLVISQRPLIIDEMDYLADKKAAEVVQDIYEASGAAILLIGEEKLPNKLRKWERFHGRILDWVPAQPTNFDDAKHLHRLYCRNIKIKDDLLKRITQLAKGSARRVCVNIAKVEEFANTQGLKEVGLVEWGDRELFTGEAPKRRVGA